MPKGVYVRSEATKEKMRRWHLSRPLSEHHKEQVRKNHKGMGGKKHTEETRLKMRETALRNGTKPTPKKGAECWNWKGGTTPKNKLLRRSKQFVEWRKAVFTRDNYTCQECGERGGELHPDHIKPFAFYPELRVELSNGRTLCRNCHIKTDSWGHKATKNYGSRRNYLQQ